MAPYRAGGRSSRSGRTTQIDHDVFEGLPVRHWRRLPLPVGAPSKHESNAHRNLQPELPMPKEAHLLSPMSRALLQAARAGTVNKPPTPLVDEEKELADEDDDGEADKGFVAKRWSLVPRNLEGPEPEYLAKRRKGLSSQPVASDVSGNAGFLKRARVRRTDPDGNAYVIEVLVPEGQTVEGEILEEIPAAEKPAPGTVVEGVGVVNSEGVVIPDDPVQPTPPPRRRPPPPRRKAKKGPGRGRKKVQFAPAGEGTNTTALGAQSAPGGGAGKNISASGAEHLKKEDSSGKETPAGDDDTEMADDSILQDGEDEEDENEDGEEGEGDDDDREEGELSPSPDPDGSTSQSKSPSKPPPTAPSLAPPSHLDLSLPPKPMMSAGPARGPLQQPAMKPAADIEAAVQESIEIKPELSEQSISDSKQHPPAPAIASSPNPGPSSADAGASNPQPQPSPPMLPTAAVVPAPAPSEPIINAPTEEQPVSTDVPAHAPDAIPPTESALLTAKPNILDSLERSLSGPATTNSAEVDEQESTAPAPAPAPETVSPGPAIEPAPELAPEPAPELAHEQERGKEAETHREERLQVPEPKPEAEVEHDREPGPEELKKSAEPTSSSALTPTPGPALAPTEESDKAIHAQNEVIETDMVTDMVTEKERTEEDNKDSGGGGGVGGDQAEEGSGEGVTDTKAEINNENTKETEKAEEKEEEEKEKEKDKEDEEILPV
ncbi:MAG: hypothetical protein M1819_007475 [Sarea resinae]|nr:MAG: hypothetical protein M1819_007475 [Sarea resinae]